MASCSANLLVVSQCSPGTGSQRMVACTPDPPPPAAEAGGYPAWPPDGELERSLHWAFERMSVTPPPAAAAGSAEWLPSPSGSFPLALQLSNWAPPGTREESQPAPLPPTASLGLLSSSLGLWAGPTPMGQQQVRPMRVSGQSQVGRTLSDPRLFRPATCGGPPGGQERQAAPPQEEEEEEEGGATLPLSQEQLDEIELHLSQLEASPGRTRASLPPAGRGSPGLATASTFSFYPAPAAPAVAAAAAPSDAPGALHVFRTFGRQQEALDFLSVCTRRASRPWQVPLCLSDPSARCRPISGRKRRVLARPRRPSCCTLARCSGPVQASSSPSRPAASQRRARKGPVPPHLIRRPPPLARWQ